MTSSASPPDGPVLALAVSGETASVALCRGATPEFVVAEQADGQTRSARMLPLVSRVMADAGCVPADLAGIAFEAGPGGFTSLRVACATAQGFGLALGIPVCAVGTLEAAAVSLALAQAGSTGTAPGEACVLVANDARMGECYFGVFGIVVQGSSRLVGVSTLLEVGCGLPAAVVAALEYWSRRCPGLGMAGDAHERHPELARALARLGIAPAGTHADAAAIARIALQPGSCWIDPADAAPRYVREKVALDVDEQRALRAAKA